MDGLTALRHRARILMDSDKGGGGGDTGGGGNGPDSGGGAGIDGGTGVHGDGESNLLAADPGGAPGGAGSAGAEGPPGGAGNGGAEAVTRESLALPEGREYDEGLGDSFLSIVNDGGLSRAQTAQKLLDLHAAEQDRFFQSLKAAADAEQKAFEEQTREWERQARNDPEYGGAAFEGNLAVILRGRDSIGTPGAAKVLADNGLGSHPEILRMFFRVGKLTGEDPGATGGSPGAGAKGRAEAMFGESLRNAGLVSSGS
jgi:hypothetical protein